MIADAQDAAGAAMCPTWAGGTGVPVSNPATQLDGGWVTGLDISLAADGCSIAVDLSSLNGTLPTAVRYAWSIVNCCDLSDPDIFVSGGCLLFCCPLGIYVGISFLSPIVMQQANRCSCYSVSRLAEFKIPINSVAGSTRSLCHLLRRLNHPKHTGRSPPPSSQAVRCPHSSTIF